MSGKSCGRRVGIAHHERASIVDHDERRAPNGSCSTRTHARVSDSTADSRTVMSARATFRRVLSLFVLATCAIPALADEPKLAAPTASSWATFRNGHDQRGIAGITLPAPLELKWKLTVEYGVVATAAIVGDFVYVPTLGGEVLCLNKSDGERVWGYRSIDSTDPKAFAPGFKSAPTVTADTVYCGDEEGMFHAIDRTTGKKKWTFTANGEIAGSAAIVADRLIFGSHDSFLYCLKVADGSEVWKFQTGDRINCSTAIAGKYTFIAGCDHHLRTVDIETGKEASDLDLDSYLVASPAIFDNMLYVGTHGSEVMGIDWKKKEIVWRYKDPSRESPYHASAAVTDQFIVVGGQDKQIHCIHRKDGTGAWRFATKGRVDSSPVIAGETVWVGSSDRNLYAINLRTGKEQWKYNCGAEIKAGPAVGEGVLVIGTEAQQGAILCFGKKE